MNECRDRNIHEIEFSLSGCGDEGQSELNAIRLKSGEELQIHNKSEIMKDFMNAEDVNLAIFEFNQHTTSTRVEWLQRISENVPQIDWMNNAGGYGVVLFKPFEKENGYIFEDMHEDSFDDEEDQDL